MEKQTTFSENLAKIKSAMRKGDAKRLAEIAGVSQPTFSSTFEREKALDLTQAEQRVLTICMEDPTLQERIKMANQIEQQTQQLTQSTI